MNKQLLASTALVAAGVLMSASQASAAGKVVKLGLHGYMEQVFGVVIDRSDAETTTAAAGSRTSFDQHTEAEIHFKGSGKLDNGITILADVQLEVTGSGGNNIDEQYIVVRGGFGQLIIGSEDSAASLMTLGYSGSWATQVGRNNNLHTGNWFNTPAANIPYVALQYFENDSSKISYFTPRFSGFQVGASYIPNLQQQTGTSGNSVALKADGTGQGYHEGWALGVNYTGKFNKVGVGVAAGFLTAESDGVNPTESSTAWDDEDNPKLWKVATKIDFGPVRVAAGVVRPDGWRTSATNSRDGLMYDIGARYTMGPNAFSITYADMRAEGGIGGGNEEQTHTMLSYRRTLGAGVSWNANIIGLDSDDDSNVGTAERSVKGWAVSTALKLVF